MRLNYQAGYLILEQVRQIARAAARIGARGQVTFGGRLAPDATGFPAAAMARKYFGDWRDPDQTKTWTTEVAKSLTS